jgi:hypothetical protein
MMQVDFSHVSIGKPGWFAPLVRAVEFRSINKRAAVIDGPRFQKRAASEAPK